MEGHERRESIKACRVEGERIGHSNQLQAGSETTRSAVPQIIALLGLEEIAGQATRSWRPVRTILPSVCAMLGEVSRWKKKMTPSDQIIN